MQRFFGPPLLLCALLTACAPTPPTVQDSYASMPDCVRDWGDPTLCTAEPDKSAPKQPDGKPMSGSRSMHFWGPRYVAAEREKVVRGDPSASRRLETRKGADQGKVVRAP
jgi:hypothetical protein